jgi:hypothetical protein
MSVNGISPTSTTSYGSPFADRRQKLEALRDALDSGDLQSAQAAFAALNQSPTTGAVSGASASTQFGSDLQAIGQALDAGDLGAAQKAFAEMRQHRHHGAHHHSAPPTNQSTTTPDAPATADNVGLSLNVIA